MSPNKEDIMVLENIHEYTCVWRRKFGTNGSPQNLLLELSIKFKVIIF